MVKKIDKIYIINLEESKDRRRKMEIQFMKMNIDNYIFFNAIKPTEDMLKKYSRFSLNNSDNVRIGELGCLLSHIDVMKDALKNNYNTIMILEDDVELLNEKFISITEKYINCLDFDILLLGANHKKKALKKIMDGIYQCSSSNGTFSYVIEKKIMEKFIINYDYKFPFDIHWKKFDKNINKFYCIVPHLVNIVDVISTIQNHQTNYMKSILNSLKNIDR